jgi:hypothetical protein
MVELTASGDAEQVEAGLREAVDAHGLQLFARIDHALAPVADRYALDGHQQTLERQTAVLAKVAAAAAG